jgi:hypothetical protein
MGNLNINHEKASASRSFNPLKSQRFKGLGAGVLAGTLALTGGFNNGVHASDLGANSKPVNNVEARQVGSALASPASDVSIMQANQKQARVDAKNLSEFQNSAGEVTAHKVALDTKCETYRDMLHQFNDALDEASSVPIPGGQGIKIERSRIPVVETTKAKVVLPFVNPRTGKFAYFNDAETGASSKYYELERYSDNPPTKAEGVSDYTKKGVDDSFCGADVKINRAENTSIFFRINNNARRAMKTETSPEEIVKNPQKYLEPVRGQDGKPAFIRYDSYFAVDKDRNAADQSMTVLNTNIDPYSEKNQKLYGFYLQPGPGTEIILNDLTVNYHGATAKRFTAAEVNKYGIPGERQVALGKVGAKPPEENPLTGPKGQTIPTQCYTVNGLVNAATKKSKRKEFALNPNSVNNFNNRSRALCPGQRDNRLDQKLGTADRI